MKKAVGTVVRGLRAPIINKGDNIEQIVVDAILNSANAEGFLIENKDIVSITESIIARAQGNYVTIEDISIDIRSKYKTDDIGVVFPIFSRNRFANCLRGIARATKKIVLMLNYPCDEVGNHLVSIDDLDAKGVNPWVDVLTEEDFRSFFGSTKHPFTGIDYVEYYKELVLSEGASCEIIFSNNPKTILSYTKNILTCDVHSRKRTKDLLKSQDINILYGLDEILTAPVNGSGFNKTYGLLGSNTSSQEELKLFPNNCQPIVESIQSKIKILTGKTVEVMVFGDGAFKDPQGKIWELADPVVSPAYTDGLKGTSNEVKLKYLADNDFSHLKGKEQEEAIAKCIENKNKNLVGKMESLGTTPRRLTDLLGSLSDLTSGSGDKGTPIIYIKGYFDNFTE